MPRKTQLHRVGRPRKPKVETPPTPPPLLRPHAEAIVTVLSALHLLLGGLEQTEEVTFLRTRCQDATSKLLEVSL